MTKNISFYENRHFPDLNIGQYNNRPLGYERVYLPLYKVAVTPFHIQGEGISVSDPERGGGGHMDPYPLLKLTKHHILHTNSSG